MWYITSKSLWYNTAVITADSIRWPTEERPRGHLEEEKAVVLDICPRTTVHMHRTGADTGCTHSRELKAERTAASTISRAWQSNTLLPSRKNSGGGEGVEQTTCPATQTSCHGSLGKDNKREQHRSPSQIKHAWVRLSCMNWVLSPRPRLFSMDRLHWGMKLQCFSLTGLTQSVRKSTIPWLPPPPPPPQPSPPPIRAVNTTTC